jgi:hypothetical protein
LLFAVAFFVTINRPRAVALPDVSGGSPARFANPLAHEPRESGAAQRRVGGHSRAWHSGEETAVSHVKSIASLSCVFLAAFLLSGCTSSQDVWRTDYPAEHYDTWSITSPDGKFHVSILKERSERASGLKVAAQYRFRHDDCPQDHVGTWHQDDLGSAGYPIFTEVFAIEDNLYLILGWTANAVVDVRLHAYLVKIEKDTMRVGSVLHYCENARLVMLADRLGLFVPDNARRDYPWEVMVFGQSMNPDEFHKASEPATGRSGYWYTRRALEREDPGEGKVYWVDLRNPGQ